MSLRELLQTDMKTAMKERESGKERLSVLRMVWAAVRNKEIDEKTELTDDAVMAVLMKEVKQREDTIKEIKDANRPDLVAKNEEEIEILKKYLPEPLSDEELKKVIQDVIATTGAKSMKDMGKVMGRVLAQTQGRAAGSRVSALVKELLNSKKLRIGEPIRSFLFFTSHWESPQNHRKIRQGELLFVPHLLFYSF